MSAISLSAQRASQTPAFEKNVRHADIDSLRGFAMLAVVVSTAYQYCRDARGQLYDGTWLGHVLLSLDGVMSWFFVVSAFLLYAPLVRQGLTGSGAITPRGFLIRRLLRAVPLYWLAIIVVWAYRTSNLPGDWRDLAEHLTFTEVFDSKRIFYTIGPAWFVADEVMFYLFIAAIMTATIRHCHQAKTRESRLLAVSAPALLLVLVSWGFKAWALFVSHVPANHWSTWFGPLAWADNLGFGMLVAVVWVAADGRLLSPRVLIGTRVGAGILFVAAVALRGQSAASVAMFHELCMISFVALLASSVFAAPDALWRRALARPFLAWIGTISFSLYIWHEPILLFLSDRAVISSTQTNFWLIAVLLLVLSVPIAFVSYWIIEYPVGHLRSLFAPGGGLRDYYADDRVHLAMVEGRDEDQPPRRSPARQGAGRDHRPGAGAGVGGRPRQSGEGGPAGPGRRDGPAARQDLDLLVGDLSTVSGQLEEFATMWRRQCQARNSWQDMPHAFPQGLREAAGRLADTLRALVQAGPDQAPDLAFSAVAQLSALDAGIAAATAAVTGDADGSAQPPAAAVRVTMSRARTRQRSLIAHLAKVME